MYTQLNQYHVILEALPTVPDQIPTNCSRIFVQSNASAGATGAGAATSFSSSSFGLRRLERAHAVRRNTRPLGRAQSLLAPLQTALASTAVSHQHTTTSSQIAPTPIPLSAFTHAATMTEAAVHHSSGTIPSRHHLLQPCSQASLGTAISEIDKLVAKTCIFPASLQADSRAPPHRSTTRSPTKSLLILAALVTVYIVLGVLLRKLHPSHHDSFHAALRRRGRAARAHAVPSGPQRGRHHRHHPADRHREEERHHDRRLRARSRARARQVFDRRHLRSQPAALPSHHDDHHGRAARRTSRWPSAPASARNCAARWASPWSAACC